MWHSSQDLCGWADAWTVTVAQAGPALAALKEVARSGGDGPRVEPAATRAARPGPGPAIRERPEIQGNGTQLVARLTTAQETCPPDHSARGDPLTVEHARRAERLLRDLTRESSRCP